MEKTEIKFRLLSQEELMSLKRILYSIWLPGALQKRMAGYKDQMMRTIVVNFLTIFQIWFG